MAQLIKKHTFPFISISLSSVLKACVCAILVTILVACSKPPTAGVATKSTESLNISKEQSRLNKARDFNPKNMFGEDKASSGTRLDRLERMVQTLRNDFDNVSPSIKRLMVLEGDLQTLITELQSITQINPTQQQTTTITPPMVNKMVKTPAKSTKTVKASTKGNKTIYNKAPPTYNGGQATVYDVRVGEHKHKTRIVIDVNAKTPYNVSLDNSESLMIVELPKASWQAAKSRNYRKSGFLKSYTVEESTNGETGYFLIFELKRDAKLSYDRVFPALSGGGAQRIVLDLTADYVAGSEDK